MPDWLQNALFGAILIVGMVVLAAIPFGVAMTFGLAWAILVSIGLAGLIGWQCGKAGMGAGAIAIPAWAGVALGLIVATVWKVCGLILALLA